MKTMAPSRIQSRIAALERASAAAVDPVIMAAKVSDKSDRKKYDFASGLKRDLLSTRAALAALCCCSAEDDHEKRGKESCTFGELFDYTGGIIANLNRVLQNLRSAGEISFVPECFFIGVNETEMIELLDKFWSEEQQYVVDTNNVFRRPNGSTLKHVPQEKRLGRSYVAENLATKDLVHCTVCSEQVQPEERITIRVDVFHMKCLHCAVCGSSPRIKADFVTFDGRICCSSDCVRRYDGANVRQDRN
jgi:hypothetical protein